MTILLWPTMYKGLNSLKYTGKALFKDCLHLTCTVTNDRTRSKDVNAIVFPWDERHHFQGMPKRENSTQYWVFESREIPNLRITDHIYDKYRNIFNWTMSYRKDSDIQNPCIKFRHFRTNVRKPKQILIDIMKKKNKFAALFVKYKGKTQQTAFIEELKTHIPIDIYEEEVQCAKSEYDECIKIMAESYKFFLLFENNLAKDHISEKMLSYIGRPSVPVVYGGGDYRVFPIHSLVDASQFDSAKELAEYLKLVGSNIYLYMDYLDWQLTGDWYKGVTQWCTLCEKLLNSTSKDTKMYDDIYKWYYDSKSVIDLSKAMKNRDQINDIFNYTY